MTDIITSLATQFGGRKLIEGHVSVGIIAFTHIHEIIECTLGNIGFKLDLTTYPVGTFAGNSALRKLVAQSNFKFRTV